MKIRMLTSLSGPAYCLSNGDERDFPQDEAVSLIEAGYAVPVAAEKRETATKKTPAQETR